MAQSSLDGMFRDISLQAPVTTRIKELPPLDAHGHLDHSRASDELAGSGVVLAMTISLDEAALAVARHDPNIVWGVGCHPRKVRAQESFDLERFRDLAERTAIVGEIGLDVGEHYGHASLERQLRTFRGILEIISDMPRIVSIHSYRATGLVVSELRRKPIAVPVLHWWTGNVEETREAVALGCYFSVHSAVARQSKFRTVVPPERTLVESDHGYADPPAAIPCRIEWVEHLVGQQLRISREDVRRLAWRNLAAIVHRTNTLQLLPKALASVVTEVS
jgi:TatD DNase family protein